MADNKVLLDSCNDCIHKDKIYIDDGCALCPEYCLGYELNCGAFRSASLAQAVDTIEQCQGFTDEDTAAGEAWARILEAIKGLY